MATGSYGELAATGDVTPRWTCWPVSMTFFRYIVFGVVVDLPAATNAEEDEGVKGLIELAQVVTVIST